MDSKNIQINILTVDDSAHTAQEAADCLDTSVVSICKSLIFKNTIDGRPVLILTSGKNRVNVKKVNESLGLSITKADADFVKENSGYSIGGVPPVGHTVEPMTYIDQDLANLEYCWAAAGMADTLFKIKTEDIINLSKAKVIAVQ
jgi:prolyl-tRNA editing enzyme YbaK/EbsC (Cys-tRNA(Pro) deacylase)